MAAETVTIDVIANFKDQMEPGIGSAKSKADKFEKSIEKTKKQIEKLGKDKTSVKIDADDKAAPKIDRTSAKLKSYAGKIYKATLGANDEAGGPIRNVLSHAKQFGGKVFRGTLSIVDKATAPIRGVMNMLFSLKTLAAGVLGGMAANQFINQPIALADQTETAFIGFETMFKSATKAQNMISEIQQFAAKTPFDTAGVVSSVQQMIRAGWKPEEVMGDMEKIGNAAAAAGQGTEGVQGIVLALQQMRMSGKLNSQDMMQLTNRGVKAWEYVADAMGTTIPKAREMAKDGLIPVDKALQGIIDGMGEYDGMMDKMSNRTVSGIMSNLKDTFDIKIVSKWGRGLADGATYGLGNLADWLDRIDPMLQEAGTSLQELGQELSTGFFDVVEKGYTKLEKVFKSDEFRNADGFIPKVKVAWDQLIAEPFGEWWDNKGYPWMIDKMTSFGRGMGSGISSIFKGLLGFNSGDVVDEATTIGGGFAKGFLDGFDGSGVWDALKNTISNAFKDALNIFKGEGDGSSWLSAALLGYGGLKIGGGLVGGYNTIAGLLGKQTLGKALLGNAGVVTSQIGTMPLSGTALTAVTGGTGKGLLGLLAKSGSALGSGATTGAGLATAGGFGLTGGIAAGASVMSGGKDLYRAFKADDSTELGKKEKGAYTKSGAKKIGGAAAGAAAGAAIGSIIPGLGTAIGGLIGAGIGGITGWISGKKDIEEYEKSVAEAEEETRKLKISQEQAKYSTKSMKTAVKDLADGTITATEFQEQFNKAVSEDKKSHFGDIKLSLQEISQVADQIVFDKAIKGLEKFASASSEAKNSLHTLEGASETLNKWSWKASLGTKIEGDDLNSFKESIDNYISSAKGYAENKHYEITAAFNVLLKKDDRKGMLEGVDEYFSGVQEQLNEAGKELKAQYNIALEDGVITADEQKIIAEAQAKMQEIVDKIAQAETEADFKTLQIKYSGADLDAESFSQLQSELQKKVQSATEQYDEALKVGISALELQYDGDVPQEELDKLIEGYNAKIDALEVRVEKFQFDALTESYGTELDKALADSDFAGTTQEKIVQAMQSALKDGVDVATWDTETAGKYLGLDSLEKESAAAITEITSNIAKTIPEKLTDGLTGADGEPIKFDASGLSESIKTGVDESVNNMDLSETSSTMTSKLSEALAYNPENAMKYDAGPLVDNVQTAVNNSMAQSDFSTAGDNFSTNLAKALTNAPMDSINTAISTVKGNVQTAINNAFATGFSTKTTVTITADYKLANPSATLSFSGGGKGTATVKGSIAANNANGSITDHKQLTWVHEEGPEAIIPLVPQRRGRGLELWEKAGKTLGVLNHANGGITGKTGGYTGGLLSRLSNTDAKKESQSTKAAKTPSQSGQIQVSVGGVTFEIHTGGNSGDIIQQIKARASEITNVLSEMISDAVSEAYENTPLAEI